MNEDQMKYPKYNAEATLIPFAPGVPPGPNCTCSYCGTPIYNNPARLPVIASGPEAEDEYRLHTDCGKQVLIRGLAAIL